MRKAFVIGVVALVLMVMVGVEADAEVSVNFSTPLSALWNWNHTSLIPAGSLFLAYYTVSGGTAGFNPVNPWAPIGDTLLIPTSDPQGGLSTQGGPPTAGAITGHGSESFGIGSSAYSPGNLYIAVFDIAYTPNMTSVPVGTSYGLGYVYTGLTQQFGQPQGPDQYGPGVSLIQTSLQTIPEPGSMALMLVGLGMVAVRRFRKK